MSEPQTYWIDRPMISTWPGRALAIVLLIAPDIARTEVPDLWRSPWVHGSYYGASVAIYAALMAATRIPAERMYSAVAVFIALAIVVALAQVFLPADGALGVIGVIVVIALALGWRDRFVRKSRGAR